MSRRRTTFVAIWLAWVAAVVLAGVAVAMGWQPAVGDWWLNLPLAVGYPLAGAIILTSRPGHRIGRLLIGSGLAAGMAMAAHQYATRAVVLEPGSLPFAPVAAWLGSWLWALGVMPAMTALPLLFPDGHLPSRRWRPVSALAVIGIGAAVVGYGLSPGPLVDFPSVRNPVGVPALGHLTGLLQEVSFPLVLAATLGAVASLLVRRHRAEATSQRRLDGVIGCLLAFVAVVVVASLAPLPLAVSAALQIGAALLVPAGIVVGVLQRRLFDIGFIAEPTLVYVSLTTSVFVLYIVVVQLVGRLGGHVFGLVAATGAVALALGPLHRRLQRGIDRSLHGDRADPEAAVGRLVSHLTASPSPIGLLTETASAIAEALHAPGVRITVIDGDRVIREATTGTFETGSEHLAVRFYDRIIGDVELARRAPDVPFGRADRRVLRHLHPHIGTAMHIVALSSDLEAARERTVLAREEERRRIRRDLHDGLGPVLAGLGLGLEGAADLIRTDPEQARDLVAELSGAVHGTIADVRRLVYELRPPSLDELGLLGALRERANSMARRPGDVLVTFDGPGDLPRLPAAVEVAIYRIAMEALTNVERHARAKRCEVLLRCDQEVELIVSDDGVGFDGSEPGLGLTSIGERVGELNGLWSVEGRRPTGTTLRVTFPLSAA